jgi:hypothetical protein
MRRGDRGGSIAHIVAEPLDGLSAANCLLSSVFFVLKSKVRIPFLTRPDCAVRAACESNRATVTALRLSLSLRMSDERLFGLLNPFSCCRSPMKALATGTKCPPSEPIVSRAGERHSPSSQRASLDE